VLGDLTASGAGPSAMRAALQFPDRPKPPLLDESGGSAGDGLPHSSGTLLGRFTPEEPAAEGAKEKSNFGGEREIGGHADENAEHQPSDRTDPDCGSGTQGAHPIDHAPAFHAERGFPSKAAIRRPPLRAARHRLRREGRPYSGKVPVWGSASGISVRRRDGRTIARSMVDVIAIIVRRSGATSSKPC
jgi:hypothetical protein